MLRQLKTAAILVSALLLAACASGPKFAEVKSSFPPLAANQGRIFFYRTTAGGGFAVQPSIMLNGQKVGDSQPGGFFYVDRPPGAYEVLCSTEVKGTTNLVLTAGQVRYVKTNISMGFFVGHVTPELIDPEEGAVAIEKLHYAPMKVAQ